MPENDALHIMDGSSQLQPGVVLQSVLQVVVAGSQQTAGQPLLAAYCAAVSHCREKPDGAPDAPAQTSMLIDAIVDVPHMMVGVLYVGFGLPARVLRLAAVQLCR